MKTLIKLAMVTVLASMLGTQNAKAATFAPAQIFPNFDGNGFGWNINSTPVGVCSGFSDLVGIGIFFEDSTGNYVATPPGTLMTVVTNSGSHVQFYLDSKCTQPAESPYSATAPLFFEDSVAESSDLTISSSGLSMVQQLTSFANNGITHVQVLNDSLSGWNAYSNLWTGSPNYTSSNTFGLLAGQCLGGFYLATVGPTGSKIDSSQTLSAYVYDISDNFQVYKDAACTQPISQVANAVVIAAGSSTSASFYIKGSVTGQYTSGFVAVANTSLNGLFGGYAQITYQMIFTSLLPPTINSFSASPNSFDRGGNTTLAWTTSNAASVEIVGLESVAASGSLTVTPSTNTTYTLQVTGTNGSVISQNVSVTVIQPVKYSCPYIPSNECASTSPCQSTCDGQYSNNPTCTYYNLNAVPTTVNCTAETNLTTAYSCPFVHSYNCESSSPCNSTCEGQLQAGSTCTYRNLNAVPTTLNCTNVNAIANKAVYACPSVHSNNCASSSACESECVGQLSNNPTCTYYNLNAVPTTVNCTFTGDFTL